jgi:hypothetical protein
MNMKSSRKKKSRRPPATVGPPPGLQRAFTIDQIVETGVGCRAKIYADIKAGRLKAKKFGRSTRVTEDAYREYLESAPSL